MKNKQLIDELIKLNLLYKVIINRTLNWKMPDPDGFEELSDFISERLFKKIRKSKIKYSRYTKSQLRALFNERDKALAEEFGEEEKFK